MSCPPSQEIGLRNAKRLDEWSKVTALKDVPRNHSGRSSKVAICRLLGISSSSIGTNNRIREIFQNLDSKLLEAKDAGRHDVDAAAATCPMPAELVRLLDSVDKLQTELARLQHLSDTGQWVPK